MFRSGFFVVFFVSCSGPLTLNINQMQTFDMLENPCFI